MNWKDIVIWLGQFALIEVAKKWPKVGDWVKANVPVVLGLVSLVVEILEQIMGLSTPSATAAMAPADTTIAVGVTSDGGIIIPAINNAIGTLVMENVVKKFIYRWFFKQVLGGFINRLS